MCNCYYSEKKGKSLISRDCFGKTAASVLPKLFFNCNERCHTFDSTPLAHQRNSYFKSTQNTFHDTRGHDNLTTQCYIVYHTNIPWSCPPTACRRSCPTSTSRPSSPSPPASQTASCPGNVNQRQCIQVM